MASLIANSNIHTFRSARPLASSSRLQMPHVFVVPPEEEQQENPPWCCFDADKQQENNGNFPSNPNIHFLDIPYLLQPSEHDVPAPITRRTSVHQPRPRAPMPKKLEKKQRPEAVKIIENTPSQIRKKYAREDSDVIEVVKVKRTREAVSDLEENVKIKRSKTLKARATKALQSIKNVGKGSHRIHVKELWTSSENMPGIFKGVQEQIRMEQGQTEHHPSTTTAPKKGPLSRASSRSLSQIFQSAKPSQPESTFTVRVETSVTLADAHYTPRGINPPSFRLEHDNRNPFLVGSPGTITPNDPLNKLVPPVPSKKNATTKFSVRDLHRLFSFSSSSSDDIQSTPIAATVPSSSSHTSVPSTTISISPSDYPDILMDQDVYADVHPLGLASRYHQVPGAHCEDKFTAPRRLSDLSLEMKLDSLHFDPLSFDPEDFDLSTEGNLLR